MSNFVFQKKTASAVGAALPKHGHGHSLSKLSSTVIQKSSETCDRLKNRKSVVEGEVFEAACVICFPNELCTPVSAPTTVSESLDETWVGGCELTVWSSDTAHAWVDKNYDEGLLVLIRERQIGGPIPSMLSVDSPAMSIFGKMSASLIRVADELAKFSGFPVIVRPLEEDPSRFRNHECVPAGNTVADSAGGNSKQGDTSRVSGSAHNVSQGGKANDRNDNPNKKGKQRKKDRDSDEDGDGKPRASTSKSTPPIQKATSNEIVHLTDVTLELSKDPKKTGERFITLNTKVKLYPPNANNPHPMEDTVSASSIAGHIDLDIRSGTQVQIDSAIGSVGFLAYSLSYLRSEHFVPLGYSGPQKMLKHVTGKQRSKMFGGIFGLAGGKPRAIFNATSGKATSSTTEVADNEVAKPWVVSRQRLFCNWETTTSSYRGFDTRIQRHLPISTDSLDIRVKYGIVSDVPKDIKAAPRVSMIYCHQVHCWVEDESKSGYRGIIVLTANYIPDIRSEHCLRIRHCPTLELPHNGITAGSEANGSRSSKEDTAVQVTCRGDSGQMDHFLQGPIKDVSHASLLVPPSPSLPKGHFVFAAAMEPEAQQMTCSKRTVQRLFKGTRKRGTAFPALISQGLMREPMGWDHTNKEWYYPIWPNLNSKLGSSSDKSRTTWRLDWGDEDDNDSELFDAKTHG